MTNFSKALYEGTAPSASEIKKLKDDLLELMSSLLIVERYNLIERCGFKVVLFREHRDETKLGETAMAIQNLKKKIDSTDLSGLPPVRPQEEYEQPLFDDEYKLENALLPRKDNSTIKCKQGKRDNDVDDDNDGKVCGIDFRSWTALKNHFKKFHKHNAPDWKGKKPVGYDEMEEASQQMVICRYVGT